MRRSSYEYSNSASAVTTLNQFIIIIIIIIIIKLCVVQPFSETLRDRPLKSF